MKRKLVRVHMSHDAKRIGISDMTFRHKPESVRKDHMRREAGDRGHARCTYLASLPKSVLYLPMIRERNSECERAEGQAAWEEDGRQRQKALLAAAEKMAELFWKIRRFSILEKRVGSP